MVIKKTQSHKLRKNDEKIFSITPLNLIYKYEETEIYQVLTFKASWKTGTPGWYVQASAQKQRKGKQLTL